MPAVASWKAAMPPAAPEPTMITSQGPESGVTFFDIACDSASTDDRSMSSDSVGLRTCGRAGGLHGNACNAGMPDAGCRACEAVRRSAKAATCRHAPASGFYRLPRFISSLT